MQRSISEGDEVLTTSGVYGFVTAVDGDIVWLEIAEDVEIRIASGAARQGHRRVAGRPPPTRPPTRAPTTPTADG